MNDAAPVFAQPAPGRRCGTCTLCCKVYDVPVLQKPLGRWCPHCAPGRGCCIWESRPEFCKAFFCLWMTADFLGPEWKPERCAFVLTRDASSPNLFVQVDPGRPAAWRAEPYGSQLRAWAQAGLPEGRHVVVFVNRTATVVLPDREVAIGAIEPGDRLMFTPRMTADGLTVDIRKVAGGSQ